MIGKIYSSYAHWFKVGKLVSAVYSNIIMKGKYTGAKEHQQIKQIHWTVMRCINRCRGQVKQGNFDQQKKQCYFVIIICSISIYKTVGTYSWQWLGVISYQMHLLNKELL